MKVRSMTATFGKLDHAKLELGEGLNLIYAPNEGGKSTWAAFFKAMLYGIDTRDRDKKGYLADKNHYQPWSGAPMEGEIQLEWQGREITIRRSPRGNTPFGSFSAVYTGTEEPVPGLTGANCGEMLTGVGLAVFSRSAFLGADNLALTSTPELERRIAALVSSGEEEVSFTQVQGRLKEWLNKRRVNKSVGEIPRLEEELIQVRSLLGQLNEITAQVTQLNGSHEQLEQQYQQLCEEQRIHQIRAWNQVVQELSVLTAQCQQLKEERDSLQQDEEIHHRLAQQALNLRYAQANEELELAQNQLDALRTELARFGTLPDRELLKRAQGELQYLKVLDEEIKAGEETLRQADEHYVQAQINAQDENFSGMSAQEAALAAQKATNDHTLYLQHAQRQRSRARVFPVIGLIAAVVGGLISYAQGAPFLLYPLYIGLGLFGLSIVATFVGLVRKKVWLERAAKALSQFHAQTPEELQALVQDYTKRCDQSDQAAQQAKVARGALNERKARRNNSWTDLMDFVHTFAPEVQNSFGCSAALSRALNLEHELSTARDKVVERRRRMEDLAAQGGQLGDSSELLPTPSRPLERVEQELSQVNAQLQQVTQQLDRVRGRQAAMKQPEEGDATPPVTPQRTPEQTEQALVQVKGELEQVSAQLHQAQGRQRAMGDPAAVCAQKEGLEHDLKRRTLEYEALALAMDTMQQSNAQLQERFSPELNQLSGQYLARLTQNKYPSVSLTRDLEGAVRSTGDILPRSALYLSHGTADQLYLAARLAVCQLCLPEKPPIVLDDALAAFDEQRLTQALKLLRELSEDQQLLLFTCHKREEQLLEGQPGVSVLSL